LGEYTADMALRLAKEEYEGLVVQTLRRSLIEQDPGLRYGDRKITIEDVRLDTSGATHMLEILLRDEARPGCLFGWRFPATEADSDELQGVGDPDRWKEGLRGPEQAEIWAGTFVVTNFVEEIEALGYGLPAECDPHAITWFGDDKP
jgi:hypothetical protein